MSVNLKNPQNKLPSNTYMFSEENKQNSYEKENHIIKTPSPIRSSANKLANDVFVYAPKGMKGSVNSNFYEFLSLGAIPYLTGSATMIALYNMLTKHYDVDSIKGAKPLGLKMALGIVLYGVAKAIGGKIIDTNTRVLTGIDPNMTYKKVIPELPENDGVKPKNAVEFHKVFESIDFPRWDLLESKSVHETGDKNSYYDKIAQRMGYKEKLNDSSQAVQGPMVKTLIKEKAVKNVVSYLFAACGVAFAMQPAFNGLANIKKPSGTFKEVIKNKPKAIIEQIATMAKDAGKSLWKANSGKALLLTTLLMTVAGTINVVAGFKAKEKNNKAEIDKNQKYKEF